MMVMHRLFSKLPSGSALPPFLEETKCRAIYNYYFPVHAYAVGVM